MNTIFFGTSRSEAIEALDLLIQETNVLFCVGKIEEGDLLNQFCKKNNIPCYGNLEFYELITQNKIKIYEETLLISYLFPNLIKKQILNCAQITAINFHPGPLPEFKGCACSCFCLYEEKDSYGVTAHYINEKFDEGDIIKVNPFSVSGQWSGKLFSKFVLNKMFELLIEVITSYKEKNIKAYKQIDSLGKYYSKEDLNETKKINKNDSLSTINKKIEAFWFPPYQGATIEIGGQKFTLVNDNILREVAELYNK